MIRTPDWIQVRTGLVLLAALFGACAGPAAPSDHERGLKDLAKLIEEGRPIQGTQVDGEVPLAADPFALAEPGTAETPSLAPEEDEGPVQQDPYIHFGERIIVRAGVGGTPFITKPYTMPINKARKLIELMRALEPFPFRERPALDPATSQVHPLDPGILEFQVLEGWDTEFYTEFYTDPDKAHGGKAPATPQVATLSDVLVVTASYSLLEQFEEFLDLFAAGGVPQIELEAKIIEVVETDQLDYGVNASLDFGSANFVKGLDFNLPNLAGTTEAILSLGAVQSSVAFDAVIQAIRTWDNVQIESRPKTVVRAGGVAYIESTTEIPFSEIKTITTSSDFTATTVYKKVGVQLYISPRIIGTKMLALDVNLVGSQQVGSQTTFTSASGQVIEVPVIAYRTARTVVYLEPGQTLLIGGLTSQRDRELESRVPILGDIPLLGLLFRSRFTRAEKQHVLFAISPRILQNSDFVTEF